MKCPNPKCQAELKPGIRFCQSCGTSVDMAGTDAQERVFPAPTEKSPRQNVASLAPEAKLCIDRLSILFEGCPSIVRFRVDADQFCAGAKNLRFTFEDQLNGYKRPPVRPRGRMGGLQEFSVTFPEQKAGAYVWYVTAECESDGRTRVFEGEVHLVVVRPGEARKVADQLAVNITTTINAGHASDVHLNQSAADALSKIVKSPEDPFNALRKLVEGSERAWAKVELFEVEQPQQQGPERLTLVYGDEVIQLVSDCCVTFGRNRDNLIPLRVCGADGHVDRLANECNISRFHFRMEREGGDCVLKDGAGESPSSYGTRVNGVPLPSSGVKRLSAGCQYEVEAGRTGVALRMQVTPHCDFHGRATGFVLNRLDGAHQRVCAVWSEVPLGDGVSISWDGCCWTLLDGRSGRIPIAVGNKISIGGRYFDVQPFHQTHLN